MNSTTTVESQSQITPGGPQGLQLATHVSSQRWQFAALFAVTLVFLVLAVFHFINIIDWAQEPDLGWSFGYAGKNIEVLSVQGAAELSGMQPGDRVVGVNGERGETLAELRQYVTREMDASNTWIVERDGRVLDITVPNLPLGFASAFLQYGLTWLVGLLLFGLGAVVFVMKPGSRASWAFLMAMFVTGLHIIFTYTSRLSPVWLGHVFTFSSVFLPATILHLAQTFPAEQSWVKRNPGLFIGSEYLLALLLFIVMVFSAPQFADVPVALKIVATIYLVLAVLAFISTIVVTYYRTNSHLARARAQVLFAALVIGAGPPLADLALALGAGIKLMPHPVFNLIFYIVIPVSIGYSIVRHNLFDVDLYIKRAVGYGIMTALVATAYFLMQTGLTRFVFEPMLGTSAQQVYPVVFALLVVFFFNPISARVQAFVDKLFFRSKLDYKETVLSVGNDIASLLNLEEIVTRIIRTVRQEMFIDTTGIVVTQKGSEGVLPFFVCNEATRTVGESLESGVKQDDPLVELIARERKLITIYDLLEDIRYKDVREHCSRRFTELHASLGLPLISKDELVGVLFIGHKKSGKFFTRDDIELLETLSTQGAVARVVSRS